MTTQLLIGCLLRPLGGRLHYSALNEARVPFWSSVCKSVIWAGPNGYLLFFLIFPGCVFLDCGGLIRDLSVFPDEDKLMVTAVIAYRDEPNQANEVVVFTLKDFLRNDEEGNYNSLRKDFHSKLMLTLWSFTQNLQSRMLSRHFRNGEKI